MFTEEKIKSLFKKAIEKALEHFKAGEYKSAELILQQFLRTQEDNLDALQLLGLVRYKRGDYKKGIEYLKRAIEIKPDSAENHNNISLCYSSLGQFDNSIKHMKKAVEINPESAHYHSNLGFQYRQTKELKKSEISLKTSLEIKETPYSWCMLGGVYGEQRNLTDAEHCFKQAVEFNPDFAEAHLDLAYLYHLRGEWGKAWPEYEYRFQCFEQNKIWLKIYVSEKKWDGKASLKGKKIILYSEQGIGDAIHFVRYTSLIKKLGAHVTIHCSPDLKTLFQSHADEIITDHPVDFSNTEKELPNYDFHASLLSIPYLLENPPIPKAPYLYSTKTADLSQYDNFYKIGIVWAGSPLHPNDAHRSCYLKQFRPIHDLPGVKIFSLQKDNRKRMYRFSTKPVDFNEGSEDMKIIDMTEFMGDFNDTASIINELDLIITVDTAVLHVAGAINKPAWALITYNPDWRWKLDGMTTELYPSVRLFRQTSPGDWKSVILEIKNELEKEMS